MTRRGLCPVYEPPSGFISERTGNSLQQLLGIVVILALMVMILLLSKLRKKKIQAVYRFVCGSILHGHGSCAEWKQCDR